MKLPKLPNFAGANKRPAYSLLYVTETHTYRLDANKAGDALGVLVSFKVSCPSTIKLADCLRSVTEQDNSLGKKVWILYDRLIITLLSIPSVQIEGVDETTLSQALRFELESLAGQSTLDTQIAYTLLSRGDDMSDFWLSQIPSLHFEDCQKVIKKVGSNLQGLLHPAGLNAFLEDPQQTDWLRLECWSRQLIALRRSEEYGLAIQLLSYDSRQWANRLEKWLTTQAPTQHSETVFSNDIHILPESQFQVFLRDEQPIEHWLSLWAVALVAKIPPTVPILRSHSTINKNLLFMGGGGGVALLFCLAHVLVNLYQTNYYNEEIRRLKQLEGSTNSVTKALADDQAKKGKLSESIKSLKGQTETLPNLITGLQRRPAQLLEALAEGRPDNLLLEEISVDKDIVRLRGLTLDSTSANELASFLEKNLSTLGWSVTTPSKTNMDVLTQGGPWEFEIKLLDLGLDGFKKKPQ